jgi:hypothetical protein
MERPRASCRGKSALQGRIQENRASTEESTRWRNRGRPCNQSVRRKLLASRASRVGGLRAWAASRRRASGCTLGEPEFPQEKLWEQGFSAVARRAFASLDIRVDYSQEYDNQETCERIANPAD